ncbi:phasin family protein [Noviherbaspirillum galbum]|uniref:Phasin family protein n=1 Tax=Noviherbaspirillum galbum TaxID=2709383 RepID=A0A6B3SQ53_9BURK|nr:phasin family protein [Noviherbaspirillum galbum]NEX62904.1 phasin family protein [Noviherbaspirillum galbum]
MNSKHTAPGTDDDDKLMEEVSASMHEIWKAGLGAYIKARHEGNAIYRDLVKEGEQLQERMRQTAAERWSGMADALTKMAEGAAKRTAGQREKLEAVFEERVSQALQTIGVPTQRDIDRLIERIEELRRDVGKLTPASGSTRKSAAAPAQSRVKRIEGTAVQAKRKASERSVPRA